MSQLTNTTDKLIKAWEDSQTKVCLLSFLILEYHVSTKSHEIGHEVLRDSYGFKDEQLEFCYNELAYYGFIVIKHEYISFTTKTNLLFKSPVKRMSGLEIKKLEDNFELFWKAYPIKVGKKKAKFEWMKLRPDANNAAKIIKAVKNQIKWREQEERKGAFVPQFAHAERWIKHERYDDECVVGTNFIAINKKTKRDER